MGVRVPYVEKIPGFFIEHFLSATNGQPGPIFIEIPVEVGRSQAEIPDYIPAIRSLELLETLSNHSSSQSPQASENPFINAAEELEAQVS